MATEFPFGKKHKGKTPERVAVEEYCYLPWILGRGIQRKDLKKRVEDVIYALDNFSSSYSCSACDQPAEYMSIALNLPYGLSASTSFIYCDDREHQRNAFSYEKARIYPIKFSILEGFPAFPKWVRKDIAKVLWELTGLDGRKTQEKLENFIEGIVQKKPGVQGKFF